MKTTNTGLYLLLYTAFFGKYEELENTLLADKVKSTRRGSAASIYENQRSDEIPTLDGSVTLMNAKFFDPRRYDLTKAGRFKLRKKLNAFARTYHTTLAQDIVGADGTIFMESGTNIRRDRHQRHAKRELNKGIYMTAFPFNPLFNHPDVVEVPVEWKSRRN